MTRDWDTPLYSGNVQEVAGDTADLVQQQALRLMDKHALVTAMADRHGITDPGHPMLVEADTMRQEVAHLLLAVRLLSLQAGRPDPVADWTPGTAAHPVH